MQYPLPGSEPSRVKDYVQRLLKDTETDALARYRLGARNLLFMDGQQHIDWNLQTRRWQESPATPGDIRTTDNYIRPIIRSRLARVLSGEFVWRAIPRSNADEDRDKAAVAENFLADRWDAQTMDNRTRYGTWLAFGCGVACLKSFWNPNLGPLTSATFTLPGPDGQLLDYPVDESGQPVMDEQGFPGDPAQGYRYRLGDTDTAVRSLFNIRVNPDAHGFDVAEGFRWLIDSEVVPLSVVQERYGKILTSARKTDVSQQSVWERVVRSVAQTFGTGGDQLMSAEPIATTDAILLSEYWEPPSETLPSGRLIVLAGDEVLYDDELPQGIVPYVPLYDERRPFDAYGRGTVNDLIGPQKVVNKMSSLILQELRAEGTGQWMGFDLPGVFDQISNVSQAHIRVPVTTQAMAIGLDKLIAHVPKSQINQAWVQMREMAKATLFDIGAYHEIQRGQVPPGVDSGVAVQHLMEAEAAQLADTVRTLKQSFIQWGRHQLTLARWGYGENEARWLKSDRDDLGFLLQDVTGADLPDPEQIDIDLDGFEPASRAAYRADILNLMEKQMIPPNVGLKLLDLGRGIKGAYESETRHYAKARAENLAMEQGEVQVITPPGEEGGLGLPILMNLDGSPFLLTKDDNHELHVERHLELALDTKKPWPLRQLVLGHIESHRQAMQMVQMEAMMQASMMQPTPGAQPQGAPQ